MTTNFSEKLLKEFRQLLKVDFGKDLNRQELVEIANNLVSYFDLLAKINHREKIKNYANRRKNNPKS